MNAPVIPAVAPVHFMMKDQLRAEAAIEPDPVSTSPAAYRTAFDDPACLKMVLNWRANP